MRFNSQVDIKMQSEAESVHNVKCDFLGNINSSSSSSFFFYSYLRYYRQYQYSDLQLLESDQLLRERYEYVVVLLVRANTLSLDYVAHL